MSNKTDPSQIPTVPAQHAVRSPADPPIRVVSKDEEAVNRLQTTHPNAPRWGLEVLHKLGKVEDAQKDHGTMLADHRRRLEILEKGGMRPRSPSLTGMREEDVEERFGALSQDQQNKAVAKGLIRSRRQTNMQTGAIITALIALAGGGLRYLDAQADRTRQETARAAEVSAREAAAAAARAAVEAVKHPTTNQGSP